jgi:hypothetical protein
MPSQSFSDKFVAVHLTERGYDGSEKYRSRVVRIGGSGPIKGKGKGEKGEMGMGKG